MPHPRVTLQVDPDWLPRAGLIAKNYGKKWTEEKTPSKPSFRLCVLVTLEGYEDVLFAVWGNPLHVRIRQIERVVQEKIVHPNSIDWTELDPPLMQMRAEGKTLMQCAQTLGVSYRSLWKHANELGISGHVRFGPKTLTQNT